MNTNPPTPLRGGRVLRWKGFTPEERALASEAYHVWRECARQRANPYGDHSGGLLAGRMAVDATRWEDGLVILKAIRQRMDSKSSPRWIAEWARDIGAQHREMEHIERKQAERRSELRPDSGRLKPISEILEHTHEGP